MNYWQVAWSRWFTAWNHIHCLAIKVGWFSFRLQHLKLAICRICHSVASTGTGPIWCVGCCVTLHGRSSVNAWRNMLMEMIFNYVANHCVCRPDNGSWLNNEMCLLIDNEWRHLILYCVLTAKLATTQSCGHAVDRMVVTVPT